MPLTFLCNIMINTITFTLSYDYNYFRENFSVGS